MKILITRPRAQAAAWVQKLSQAGLQPLALPLIEIAALDELAPLVDAWHDLPNLRFVMFVSANAVQQFFAARPGQAQWPAALSAGATGPGTAQALAAAGLDAAQIEQPASDAGSFDAEALWARIRARDWPGARVLVVRGEDGRDWLAERWRERGARVRFLVAYKRQPPRWTAAEAAACEQALVQPGEHLWLFTSSEGITFLHEARPQADWRSSSALATHARIAQAARDIGFGRVVEVKPSVAAIVAGARSVQSGTP